MARRSRVVPLFALALCVAAAWLYFSPYVAYRKITRAADRGDVEALNDVVDFPALRTSIRTEVQSATARGIQKDGGVFATIGAAAAGFVVGPVVDAAVTPEGIGLLMKGKSPGDRQKDSDDGESWRDDVKITRRWEAADRFVVRYSDRASGDERISLVMRRDGLDWNLAGIRFPAPEK